MMHRAFVRALALTVALQPMAAFATVPELVPPTSGIYTGVQFSQKLGDAFRTLASCNKGPTAPANVGGSTVDGLCWIDDSVTPWIKKRFVNGGWAVEGALDPSDSSFAGVIGGGIATIASGATVDLGSVPQANVLISGAATITSLGATAPTGIEKTIRFDNVSVLTPSAALLVPGGFPLATAAGDRAKVTHLGSGNWEVTQFTRASGIPVDISAVGKPTFDFSASISPLHVAAYGQALLRTSYPAYLFKVTRVQNGTRGAGSLVITGLSNTSGFGPGMPVEMTGLSGICVIGSLVPNTSITLVGTGCNPTGASGTTAVTVFLTGYGAGGDQTKVGVPDCRTRVLAGRDRSDPGSLANLLTTNYFGADAGVFGAIGGGESRQIFQTHLPNVNFTNSGIAVDTSVQLNYGYNGQTAQTPAQFRLGTEGLGGTTSGHGSSVAGLNITASVTAQGVSNSGGSGTPLATVMPALIADCVLRVIP